MSDSIVRTLLSRIFWSNSEYTKNKNVIIKIIVEWSMETFTQSTKLHTLTLLVY